MAQALNEPQNENDYVWPISLILNPASAMAFLCVKCQGIPKACMINEEADILCAKCAENMGTVTAAKVVQKLINKLKTKCLSVSQNACADIKIKPSQESQETEGSNIMDTKESEHCDWTGQIQGYEEHGKECSFVVIICDKCNSFKCRRKLIDKHFSQCPQVSIDCPLSCGSKILRKNTNNHLQNVCVNQLLFCTNDDCKMQIERKHFKHHVDGECESRIVGCRFEKYGCKIDNIRANNLQKHMDEYKFEHLSNKFDFVTTQQQDRIENLEEKLNGNTNELKQFMQQQQNQNNVQNEKIIGLQKVLKEKDNKMIKMQEVIHTMNDSKESDIKQNEAEQNVKYNAKFSSKFIGKNAKMITPTKIQTKSDNQSARFDLALPAYKQSPKITEWKVQFLDGSGGTALLNHPFYFFGVVSESCTDFSLTANQGLKEAYGISAGGSTYKYVWKGSGTEQDPNFKASINFKDVVKMQYDSFASKLLFIKNNEQIYQLKLPTNKVWYPAVSWLCTCPYCQIVD